MKFVWVGSTDTVMIVNADSIEEACKKVSEYMADALNDLEMIPRMMDTYKEIWFLYKLADQEL